MTSRSRTLLQGGDVEAVGQLKEEHKQLQAANHSLAEELAACKVELKASQEDGVLLGGVLDCAEALEMELDELNGPGAGGDDGLVQALEGVLDGAEGIEAEAERLQGRLKESEGRCRALEEEVDQLRRGLEALEERYRTLGEADSELQMSVDGAQTLVETEVERLLYEARGLEEVLDATKGELEVAKIELTGMKRIVDAMHAGGIERDQEVSLLSPHGSGHALMTTRLLAGGQDAGGGRGAH